MTCRQIKKHCISRHGNHINGPNPTLAHTVRIVPNVQPNGDKSGRKRGAQECPRILRPIASPATIAADGTGTATRLPQTRHTSPAKHLGRPDEHRLRGDLVVVGQEHQIVSPWLLHAYPQLVERHLHGRERIGVASWLIRRKWLAMPLDHRVTEGVCESCLKHQCCLD